MKKRYFFTMMIVIFVIFLITSSVWAQDDSTAYGKDALSCSTGYGNSAYGYRAIFGISGSYNTANGYRALGIGIDSARTYGSANVRRVRACRTSVAQA